MSLFEKIVNGEEKISLVGLGYVGMPIAVAFSKKVKVVGYDLNAAKIELYKNGVDPTNEVGGDAVKACSVEFTADETKLRETKFHIVAVPTPVNEDHTPDLIQLILKQGKAAFSQNCRDYALEHFQKEKNLREYLNLFETLCKY